MKVAFLVNDLQLSGGVGVVIAHARQLAEHHGFDVTLVLAREQETPNWEYETLAGLHVAALHEAQGQRFDVAVATWWETTYALFTVPADRHVFFVQSLEDRFYRDWEPERSMATLATGIPASFITEATWIADILRDLHPEAPCYLVRNGIDKDVFAGPRQVVPHPPAPLRVLVEGNPTAWFKHVPEAIQAVAMMDEPHHLTVVTSHHAEVSGQGADRIVGPVSQRELAALYADVDVVLKLSSVEGMFGPPLEGFHMGATCLVAPVTGHEEYVEHGWNGLVCDWDDPRGTARLLDLLARDRRLLHVLRSNALRTAKTWPSWEQSSQFMALALRRIRSEPPPPAAPAAMRLLGDARAATEMYRRRVQERNEFAWTAQRVEQVKRLPAVREARAAWRAPRTQRTLGPVVRWLWRRLSG